MIEIILAILVIGCIIYIFRGDFTRRNAGVTVLESLPLSIFKKWSKENNNSEQEEMVEINNTKTSYNKNTVHIENEVLSEVALTTINEESEDIEIIDGKDNIGEIKSSEEVKIMGSVQEIKEEVGNEVNNSSENMFNALINESKESIKNKEVKENSKEINKEINNINEMFNEKSEELVFWTPKGKTYHTKSSCSTLARSKVINSGTVYESGKDFKCEHCK
ncbi:hypothetical protein [Clostridium sp. D53t1_180928_C8]|uniref:hypothetical protein n=1 Tax=Clostridium sp. D53t1_180928_C8 TaxID=2787101 RepID=UPI0018AAD7C8|nr:hypothetical protein [Clostridium sp. D53t1_180928_C8]